MRRTLLVLLPALCAAAADETGERIFRVPPSAAVANFQEIATVMRVVARIPQASFDPDRQVLLVRGTADQLRMAEWLVAALEQPSSVPPEFRVPGAADDSLRVFYLTHAQTPADLQEMTVLVRSLADAQFVYAYSASKTLVLRENAWRIALTDWLVGELDQPAQTPPPSGKREFRLSGGSEILPPEDVFVRIFYMRARTPEDLSAIFAGLRSAVKIPRSFPNATRRAIIVRASAEKIALAEQALSRYSAP